MGYVGEGFVAWGVSLQEDFVRGVYVADGFVAEGLTGFHSKFEVNKMIVFIHQPLVIKHN